ncbi:uncharacterized protein [Watersipora subatra]|uniref:uncharacterized protein n=1 Tax=Watersipora subatra TaxID=2589382 RepID=UPI00355C2ECF
MPKMLAADLSLCAFLIICLASGVGRCAGSGNVTEESSEANKLCPECPVFVSFGNLTVVPEHTSRPINSIAEDMYNPGTFFYASGFAVTKVSADGSSSVILGSQNRSEMGYVSGNSDTARFTLISQIKQYNETILLLADYINNCVREYNSETDLVRQMVGNCLGSNSGLYSLSPGDVKPADTHYMVGAFDIEFLRKNKSLLTLDFGYQQICRYDYTTDTVQLLHPSLKQQIPRPYDLLVNSDETMMYVIHSYAISSVDLQTFEVRLLVGTVADVDSATDVPFSAGPFSTATIGLLDSLKWLVPDQLLVSVISRSTQALVFLDLKGEQVYSACVGGLNDTNTVTGNIEICELNAPTAIEVFQDHSIFIATLSDVEPESYNWQSNSSFYQLQTTVSVCDFQPPTGKERATPGLSRFYQFASVTVSCPRGMAVASHTKRRTCGANFGWDQPIPECVEVMPHFIKNVSPTAGQVSGGTVVTASGYIPDVGLQLYLKESSGSVLLLQYQQVDQSIKFTMPRRHTTGSVSLVIVLTEGVEATIDYEYREDPVAQVERSATLSSEGVDLLYTVINGNPSERYELQVMETGVNHVCFKEDDTLNCGLGFFPNVTKEPSQIDVELLSYGVRIATTEVTVYPDPQLQIQYESVHRGDPLNLNGSFLNIMELNEYYEVNIQLSEDITVPCVLLDVKDDLISCLPELGNHEPGYDHKPITVKVGNLELGQGLVVFLNKESPRDPEVNSSFTSIAVTIAALATLVIIAVVLTVYCFKRLHPNNNTETKA